MNSGNGGRGKGRIVAIIVVVVVVLAAALGWFSGIIGGISEAEAKEIAYAQVPGAAEADTAIVMTDFDDLRKAYDVQFVYENVLYEFKILARGGKIVEQDAEGAAAQTPAGQTDPQAADQAGTAEGTADGTTQTAQTDIGLERAREIALAAVPGAAAGDITGAQADNDDGRLIYEVEIRYDGREYDFDIDAATGEIISRSDESIFD